MDVSTRNLHPAACRAKCTSDPATGRSPTGPHIVLSELHTPELESKLLAHIR